MAPTIVVGFDQAPQSTAALRWAADQARLTQSDLRAIVVLDWPIDIGGYGYTWEVATGEDMARRVREYKGELRRRFSDLSPCPEWTLQFVEDPRPGRVLVTAAAEAGASLLVVGTREHTGMDRIVYGSVSHYCLSHAGCPVVAVCASPTSIDSIDAAPAAASESTGQPAESPTAVRI